MSRRQGQRIACAWFPLLAIERWAKSSGEPLETPVVLTIEGAHGPIIHAVTQAAAQRGARAGSRLVDARALDPGLIAIPADPVGDDALVRTLARWAGRWSPLVEADGHSLKLDVTGAAHLFGGEAALADDIRDRFAALGLTARVAIAPTAAAAWALARHDPSICGSDIAARLAPLPVAALRLSPQAVRTLGRLGLRTIGDLAGIERRSLARRFRDSDNPVDALDRALGRKPEPLTAERAERPPRASLRLAEPVADPSAAARALDRLIPMLVSELQQRQLGARRLALSGFRVDASVALASAATSIASREPAHLKRLLADKAAALDPGFGFDAFALEASWAEPLADAQDSLIGEPPPEREVARLIDRLSVKLGPRAVRRPVALDSYVPERASGWAAAVNSSLSRSDGEGDHLEHGGGVDARSQLPLHRLRRSPSPAKAGEELRRPQRLLDRPEAIAVVYATPEGLPRRFVWRRAVHDIARVEGPERIAPEWWRSASTARLRDYYRVEDVSGRRYWIYREGLAGDGRGGAPGWFLHGLFS